MQSEMRLRVDEARRRLKVLNDAADAGMELVKKQAAKQGDAITCRGRGCSGCCHQLPTMSFLEGLNVLEWLRERGMGQLLVGRWGWVVRAAEYLKNPRARVEEWFNQQRGCVFLVDDACAVYEVRPVACRLDHSIDDPKRCDYDESSGETQSRPKMDVRDLLHALMLEDMSVARAVGLFRGDHPLPYALMFASMLRNGLSVEQVAGVMAQFGIDNPNMPEIRWATLELSPDGKTYWDRDNGLRQCCMCKAMTPPSDWSGMQCPRCGTEHVP